MNRFFHYQLRTTDVPAAREFYACVLGRDQADVSPLDPQALARGARPHWLGHLGVADVNAAAATLVARGAALLKPSFVNAQGLEMAVLRDPGGAIVALSKPDAARRLPAPEVVWHQLSTPDVLGALESYRELLAWDFQSPFEVGSLRVQPFAWQAAGAAVGGMSGINDRPHVHPHWLFHFRVASLEGAVAAVRRAGGIALDALVLPSGVKVAVCDDAQGAAFALQEGP